MSSNSIDIDGGYARLAHRIAAADLARSHPELGAQTILLAWSCKALQNRQYVLTAPAAGILYEVAYDGDLDEWRVERYRREEPPTKALSSSEGALRIPTQAQAPSAAPSAARSGRPRP